MSAVKRLLRILAFFASVAAFGVLCWGIGKLIVG